jgi:hypothetical protein
MCQKETAHLADNLLKETALLKQEWQKSPAGLGPGKQTAKTWFGLEK